MTRYLPFIAIAVLALLLWTAPGDAADRNNGRQLYEIHCVGCHGETGYSIDPTVPSFASGDVLFLMDSELLDRIRDGKDGMPSFRGMLSDNEIRDVIAYLRTF